MSQTSTDSDLAFPPEPIEIAAGWLQLRPWADHHRDELAILMADPEELRWSPVRRASAGDPIELAQKRIDRALPTWQAGEMFNFAVQDSTSGALLGEIQLTHIDRFLRSGLLGYSTMPAARGRGVASAAVQAITRWAFEGVGIHRLELSHAIANVASCRVAVKAGYPIEGILKSYLPNPAGGWWDMELHALVNPADAAVS